MLWLPALSRGDRVWRLPLANASISTLVDVLLDCPAANAAARLTAAIERDPGLALWIACQPAIDLSAPQVTPGQLGQWLAESASRVLTWSEADLPTSASDQREDCRRLTLESLQTAMLARALAADSGAAPAVAESSYLVGLLSNAESWLALGAPQDGSERNSTRTGIGAGVLPAWLVDALDKLSPDSPVAQARKITVAGCAESPSSVAFDRRLLAVQVDEAVEEASLETLAPFLPPLARKLARLRELETRFAEKLTAEKLAAMAEFAAGAGHEINNPIAVIAGRAQLFLRDERDPERRRELAVMNSQAMRVYEMISDMMLFARPPKPKLAQCDISQAIANLLAEIAPAAEARHIELESVIGDEPLMIRADREQLGVVLRSLAENALEAMSHGGRLQVAARLSSADGGELPARQALEITVRDNGPGIPPDARPHLFDPFYSGRAAGRGLGLGLSKSWRIVANHGGRIDVESEFGRGAAFIVRLPA